MANLITANDSKLLFTALGANGVFSSVSGLTMVLASNSLANFLGISQPQMIFELGIMLIGFGALLIYFYRRKRVHVANAIAITVLDLAWVAGSAILVVAMPDLFSSAGMVSVIAVAVVVLMLFDLQAYAIWRARRITLRAAPGA